MNDPKAKREYSTDEVGAIVRIALERQTFEGRISHDELLETAREIGVSAEDIEEAVADEARIGKAKADIEEQRQKAKRNFIANLAAFITVNAFLFAIDRLTTGGTWFYWPLLAWALAVVLHAVRLIFSKDAANATAQLEAARGKSRARIDEAFGASSRVTSRRTRSVRPPPTPTSEDNERRG